MNSPGSRAIARSPNFAAAPSSDFICGALQLAILATPQAFTAGLGTPYGLDTLPTTPVALRSVLARLRLDLIDFEAEEAAKGDASPKNMGEQIFEHILAVASGHATWSARRDVRNALDLLYSAPVA